MSASELRRFDFRVAKDVLAAETGKVAVSSARFSFFGQGATVSEAATIPTGSSQLKVHDSGALATGSTVLVGLEGKSLSVTTVVSRTLLTVSNGTGAAIAVSIGTRLILESDPVTIYSDAGGSTPVAEVNAIDVGSSDPAAVWVPRPMFDYVGAAGVELDASSSSTLTGASSTLSWSHTASGTNRLVLVGISWMESLGEETLDSVTYGGTSMTLLASTATTALYSLVNPPTGAKTIVATWSGSNSKGAIGGATSLTGVNQTQPLGSASSATGNSTSPSVTVSTNSHVGMILSLVAVSAGSSLTTLSVGGGG